MYIKASLRSTAKHYALRSWFDGKKCPREDYFRSVDGARTILRRHLGDQIDPDWAVLAAQLAITLNGEGALYAYVDGNDQEVDNEAQWEQICLAAAWVILDRYDQAITKGTWTPQI